MLFTMTRGGKCSRSGPRSGRLRAAQLHVGR